MKFKGNVDGSVPENARGNSKRAEVSKFLKLRIPASGSQSHNLAHDTRFRFSTTPKKLTSKKYHQHLGHKGKRRPEPRTTFEQMVKDYSVSWVNCGGGKGVTGSDDYSSRDDDQNKIWTDEYRLVVRASPVN